MQREEMVFVGTSDLSGHFRGKSILAVDLPARLENGIGIAPTNLFISAFGSIQSTPFGTRGEVFLMPDAGTHVRVPFEGGVAESFLLADIHTEDGRPWQFCPRHVLKRALERLARETGLTLLAAFEQEFIYSGVPDHPVQPYELDAYRRQGAFGETLVAALRQAGVVPDSFLAEFGPQQYELTTAPAVGMRAADEAVITREITQAVAFRFGQRVSFAPKPSAHGVSNGTHIHFSFLDGGNRPVLYEPERPLALSAAGAQFAAGILHHLPALCAVTAPSVASYYRLRPNHWAPLCADIGALDRGAALRICPVRGDEAARARQFNLEFRVADATASPYLALAVMVQAGLEGIRSGRELTPRRDAVEGRGTVEGREPVESPEPAPAGARPLPSSLSEALVLLERTPEAADWLGAELLAGYLDMKRAEIAGLEGLDESEICRRYAEVY